MLRKSVTLIAVSLFFATLPAQAQFSDIFNKITGGSVGETTRPTGKDNSSSTKDATELVTRFVAAQKLVLDAQIAFAKSFGLADQVKLLQAERKAISSGSVDKSVLEKSVTVSDRARKAIAEKMESEPTLNASSKAHYARGLIALAGSVSQAKKLPNAANRLMQKSSSNPFSILTAEGKLATSLWVAKETPGYLTTLASTTKSALSFGKLMGISLPKNADALLGDL
ncbi:MAG: hypothetical protein LBR88_09620 [Zoogloeaceae bacterium]|nr:hypothetical protein [Zoogloeaceae bacterium]